MTRRILLSLFFAFLAIIKGNTQSFMHGIGSNISIITAKINTPASRYTFAMSVVHFSYFPRYTISESENSSVSIGSPLGAGIGLLSSSGSDASGIAWGGDAPIVVDYNIGCQSTPDNEKTFGGYFGGGFGFMYTGWTDGGRSDKAISYGPLARTGVRFSSSRANWSMTLGIYFKYGLEKEKYKTFGFNVLADL